MCCLEYKAYINPHIWLDKGCKSFHTFCVIVSHAVFAVGFELCAMCTGG